MVAIHRSEKSSNKTSKRKQSQQLHTTHSATQLESYLMDIQNFELISQGEASHPIDMSAQMATWQSQWENAGAGSIAEVEYYDPEEQEAEPAAE